MAERAAAVVATEAVIEQQKGSATATECRYGAVISKLGWFSTMGGSVWALAGRDIEAEADQRDQRDQR